MVDLKRLVDYILLYLIVDSELDSSSISYSYKCSYLLALLQENKTVPSKLNKMYCSLVSSELDASVFSHVTLTTAQSFLVQYNVSSAAELFEVCVNKGGQAVLAGYRLVYGNKCLQSISDDQLLILGACIQLLDDIVDCSKDKRDGIETIATWTLRELRQLDYLAILLFILLFELEEGLAEQRDGLLVVSKRAVDRSSSFSANFRERLGLRRYK
ncbi:Hypothetical protein POVR2_LOCUS104 [uncultured virus]|nr:Hypothetical protein POVR2_LOCUS104 [uncultured virus]